MNDISESVRIFEPGLKMEKSVLFNEIIFEKLRKKYQYTCEIKDTWMRLLKVIVAKILDPIACNINLSIF